MKKKLLTGLAGGLFMLCLSTASYAKLIVAGTVVDGTYAGAKVINDTDLNITWLDYTHQFGRWEDQVNWASSLSLTVKSVIGDISTLSDWRLPITSGTLPPDQVGAAVDGSSPWGYNNTASEMGHLFYTELGNSGQRTKEGGLNLVLGQDFFILPDNTASWLVHVGPFENLLSSIYYSGTTTFFPQYDASHTREYPWLFAMHMGVQIPDVNYGGKYGLAVHPGQLNVSEPVPEPATMLLMGTGLTGLIAVRRKKKI